MATFVITTDHVDLVWVSNLKREQQEQTFDTKTATINVVTQEQVCCFLNCTSDIEQTQKIIVLAMKITANCYDMTPAHAKKKR